MATSRTRLRAMVAAVVGLSLAALPAGGSLAADSTGGAAEAARAFNIGTTSGAGWSAEQWTSSSGSTTLSQVASVIGSAGTNLTGAGVGVALVDTGVVPVAGLPKAKIVNGPDLSFESQAANLRYLDTYGHGTHLAGVIVGNDAATGTKGIAPDAKLTSVRVGTAQGAVDVSQVIAAIDWVIQHRNDDPANPIRVLNLAYGTDGVQLSTYDPVNHAVEAAWRAGIVVVVAAGNSASTSTMANPAYDPFVLAVGSAGTNGTTTRTDDKVSTFTARSSRRELDIVAPGESIVSLRNPGGYLDVTYPSARVGTTLFKGSGTSQAAAVTSAAVALLLQRRPSLTPDQVKALLKSTATPLSGAGVGELNLGTALTATVPSGTQTWARSTGYGSMEHARGSVHVSHNGRALVGDFDIFGGFNATVWAQKVTAGTSWQGGSWMGRRMAGDGWTGTSWASRTWAGATWTGTDWGAQAWAEESWNGHYWSGHYWSGNSWSGHYWSGHYWSAAHWG